MLLIDFLRDVLCMDTGGGGEGTVGRGSREVSCDDAGMAPGWGRATERLLLGCRGGGGG